MSIEKKCPKTPLKPKDYLCVKGVPLKPFGNLIVAPKFSAMSELLPNGHHFVLRFTPGFTTVRKLLAFIYKALPKFNYILLY